ncbi:MAG: mechanosensitive ion channel family protein, partial [Pseudomonadota bacterium]
MRTLAVILLFFCLWSSAAVAQDAADRAREKEIAAAAGGLARLSSDLADEGVDDPLEFERDVRGIIAGSRARLAPVAEALKRAEDSLALLGPEPKEGEPAEAPMLAAERRDINSRISFLRGQRTRILATIDSGVATLGELSKRRLRDLYRNVVRREAPIFVPALWAQAAVETGALSASIARYFAKWGGAGAQTGGGVLGLGGLAAAFLASYLMFGPVRDRMRRVFTARIVSHEPTPARRVAVAGIEMLTRLIPGLIGGFIIIATARATGLLGMDGAPVARAIWIALIAYLLVDGFASGLFAPTAPAWRLAPVEAAKGKRASALLLSIVFVVGAKSVFVEIARAAGASDALQYAVTGVSSAIVGGLLLALCEKKLWASAAGEPAKEGEAAASSAGPWPSVRFAGRLLGALIIASVLAGYINLADFASTRLYYLALLLAVAWFLRAALKEAAAWADHRLKTGRRKTGDRDENRTLLFWIGAGIDFVLLMFVAPVLLALAGVDWASVRDLFLHALAGFRIGGVFISLSDIFLALAAFVGILLLTRVLQGALQRGPLAHSRVDIGIQNSLTTLFGYAGLVIAAIVGLGVVGVDFSNLALIAGALSVGIGFGLQSIVNNFVSGLILLFERPIKAGDWIVTASGEGIVKKISVRSTELETFDRASIIIPNSELVASTVTNWTHKSSLGRISVPVGVSYDVDPDHVRELLLKCANAHPLVVRYPEPFVVWKDFGPSSLDFE